MICALSVAVGIVTIGTVNATRTKSSRQHKHKRLNMNYPTAIVVSAGLIASAMFLTSQGHSQPAAGRYAVSGDTGYAWVLDTTAGTVWGCKSVPTGGAIVCTPPKTLKP